MIASHHAERNCPVCGSTQYTEYAEERIDPRRINSLTYSSRKEPEFMRLRLVQCVDCDVLYAPSPPQSSQLNASYALADYDSNEEAQCAAKSYIEALKPYFINFSNYGCAIDVGAGNGALLPLLQDVGFLNTIGIEPSRAAIAAAPASIRSHLIEGAFTEELISGLKPTLICSFMTLEHLSDPRYFVKTAYNFLEPEGLIAIVVHNWKGFLNQILGLRSPIIDIEHLQLFCPKALMLLLSSAGFKDIRIKPILNSYPLRYWLKLTPLPLSIKTTIGKILVRLNISRSLCSFSVGNILAVAKKPLK